MRRVPEGPRSNSFHYTVAGVAGSLAAARWALCPVRPTAAAWPRGRVVFVRRGARVGRFATETTDFDDAALEGVVHGLGQLYLDVSRKDALDDFARDLVKLTRSPVCEGCPARGACAGMFEPVAGDVFTPDDARVRAVLEGLRGAVLDVGCGEGPYGDILAEAARRGDVTYAGVDPDAARIEGLRARWPWALLRVAPAEALPDDLPPPDHVLVLRSWNHLRNPVRALESFAERLRPGGTLTVVDNVAFGLVRGSAHARRAERGAAVFEHHRNDGAGEADAAVRAAGGGRFELLERRDVSPATSNQWLLRYRRR